MGFWEETRDLLRLTHTHFSVSTSPAQLQDPLTLSTGQINMVPAGGDKLMKPPCLVLLSSSSVSHSEEFRIGCQAAVLRMLMSSRARRDGDDVAHINSASQVPVNRDG